jgi:hypothetical protein
MAAIPRIVGFAPASLALGMTGAGRYVPLSTAYARS